MSRPDHILLVSTGLLSATLCQGQTRITALSVDPFSAAQGTLLTIGLAHDGAPGSVRVTGDIRSDAGEHVLHFTTRSIPVAPGAQVIAPGSLAYDEFVWATTPLAAGIRAGHQFTEGEYEVCATLTGSGGNESFDEFCDRFAVEEQLFLDLTEPWDRDTIDEVRPSLFWNLSGTLRSPADMDLMLVLAPLGGSGDAQRAVGASVPTFRLKHPAYPVTPFPSGAPSLERGKCYAWQVQLERNGLVRERSEAWSFCVRPEPVLKDQRYVVLGNEHDRAIHQAVDDRLYFRWDEPYTTEHVVCEVLNERQERIAPEASRMEGGDHPATVNARSLGINLYEFDLAAYDLRPGTYELRVRDGKGHERSMLFSIDAR